MRLRNQIIAHCTFGHVIAVRKVNRGRRELMVRMAQAGASYSLAHDLAHVIPQEHRKHNMLLPRSLNLHLDVHLELPTGGYVCRLPKNPSMQREL